MNDKRLILLSLLLAAFAINLDTTIVNVALPTLVRELHASTTQLQWIVDAYSLVFAALLLTAGSLSDRLGRKPMLLGGLAVFGLAGVAGGLTTTPGALIAARCFMGLGAAVVFPATLSLISNTFTERSERARGDRPLGRDRRRRDRAGPDHRRLAAGPLLLAEHLLRPGARRGGRRVRSSRRSPTRVTRTRRRWTARLRAVDRGDDDAHLHDHRGPGPGMGSARTLGGFALTVALGVAFTLASGARGRRCWTSACSATCASRPPAARSRSPSSRCWASSS